MAMQAQHTTAYILPNWTLPADEHSFLAAATTSNRNAEVKQKASKRSKVR